MSAYCCIKLDLFINNDYSILYFNKKNPEFSQHVPRINRGTRVLLELLPGLYRFKIACVQTNKLITLINILFVI